MNSTESPVRSALLGALAERVRPGQEISVAYSGGLDSTVALYAIASLQGDLDFRLSALHVNHGLSPNADDWQMRCKKFAEALNLPFQSFRVSVESDSGEGLEQSARMARYAVFESLKTDWIVLAHHADDQAETILHNLARGSGVLGLAGMPACRGRFLRPLLLLPRETLTAYANDHHLDWIEDESNADVKFTRNYFRQKVLPEIRFRYPDFPQKSALAGRRIAEAQHLLNDLAEIDAMGNTLAFPFPSDLFSPLNEARGANLFRALLTRQGLQNPPEQRLREFITQLATAGPDRHPEIRLKDHVIRRQRGLLHLIPIEN